EAFAENALADHAGCSEEDYVHGFMLQRWRGSSSSRVICDFSVINLFAQSWVGNELWHLFFIANGEEGEVGKADDLRHLGEVDLIDGVGDVVVVGVEAGEEPKRGNVVEDEGELVGAEEDAESGVAL